MDKKNNAIFSVKMNSHNAVGFNSDMHIEGGANDILNCLKAGLKQLHRGGIPKSILLEVVETACKESKGEKQDSEESKKQFEEALEDAPREVKEAIAMLKELGLI